jgi:hypothetical protein
VARYRSSLQVRSHLPFILILILPFILLLVVDRGMFIIVCLICLVILYCFSL